MLTYSATLSESRLIAFTLLLISKRDKKPLCYCYFLDNALDYYS